MLNFRVVVMLQVGPALPLPLQTPLFRSIQEDLIQRCSLLIHEHTQLLPMLQLGFLAAGAGPCQASGGTFLLRAPYSTDKEFCTCTTSG